MFIGHFAVAFAVRSAVPKLSLGMLFIASQLADLVWPTLVLLGFEYFEIRPGITAVTPIEFTYYPYSHSLVALTVYGVVLGITYFNFRNDSIRAAMLLAAVVVSHWVLDVVSHRPDMPITLQNNQRLGFGLWDSVGLTAAVEVSAFIACVGAYMWTTRSVDRIGQWALMALVVCLLVIYALSVLGPPPPSVTAVVWSAQAIWLLVAWAFWIDRHRTAR